jgi:hypothetical protein
MLLRLQRLLLFFMLQIVRCSCVNMQLCEHAYAAVASPWQALS